MGGDENQLTLEDVYPFTLYFQPHRDEDWRVIEDATSYVRRMQAGPLPRWPEELLKEWLHRHANDMEDYAFLGFSNLVFSLDTWGLGRLPGREAFRDERLCDSFQDVEVRAEINNYDWLAHYMLKEGTWNTPIVLFDNSKGRQERLKRPFHLLEGHRRLSFLQGLKRLGIAAQRHSVWIATVAN